MRSNELAPNVGGQPVQAAPKSKMPACSAVVCPHRNDRHRKLKITIIVLICLEWILLILQIVATQQTMEVAPYSYTALIMIVSLIVFWFVALVEIGIFAFLTKKTMEEHTADGHGFEDKHWFRRYVLERYSCLFRTLAMIGSFIMLWIIVIFLYPEVFNPTGGMVYYRIAGVTPTTATFFIRNPDYANGTVRVEYRVGNSGEFTLGGNSAALTEDSDYTAFLTVENLAPGTQYDWKFSIDDTVRQFKTNPAQGTPTSFSFVFGSCFTYNFPWHLDATGFEHILELNPDLINFLGDFVYADVPLLRGTSVGQYRSLYRQNFRNKGVYESLQAIPSYFMWDDHEVYNDWQPDDVPSFENAIDKSWKQYVGGGNPQTNYSNPRIFYFDYDYGDTSFFVMDTRFNRSLRSMDDGPEKTLLGAEQKAQLFQWLLEKNSTATFKFLMSPVGWTIEYPDTKDSWGGYRTERDEILDFIQQNQIKGVLFFSADSHFAYALELRNPGSGLFEFGASPVDAFDFTLGIPGYNPEPWKPESERTEKVIWSDIGGKGSVSFIGQVQVNTQAPTPYVNVSIWGRDSILYTVVVTADQINTP